MASQDAREYSVALSDDILSRLRQGIRKSGDTPALPSQIPSPNFTIRYSVPPELLKRDNCELNLRKSTRGEYIVEDATALGSGRELGTGKEEGSFSTSAPRASGPSFRGPGTGAQEHECVLVYNEQLQKYELHALHMNFQVAPVLKSRPRSSTKEPCTILREQPSRDSSSSSSRNVSPQKGPSASVPRASSKSAVFPPTPANSASAAFIPKTSTRARLPTRRKLPNAKPPLSSRNATESPPPPTPYLSATQPPNDPSRLGSAATSTNPPSGSSSVASCNVSDTNFSPSISVPSLAESPSSINPKSSEAESGFDDSFEDLADELADELMEDEEETARQTSKSMGTAGGSAQDDDVISEEE